MEYGISLLSPLNLIIIRVLSYFLKPINRRQTCNPRLFILIFFTYFQEEKMKARYGVAMEGLLRRISVIHAMILG